MFIRRVNPGDLRNAQNVLDAGLVGDRAGDAAVDAENILVDYGGEGDAVEDLICFFPDAVTYFFSESGARERSDELGKKCRSVYSEERGQTLMSEHPRVLRERKHTSLERHTLVAQFSLTRRFETRRYARIRSHSAALGLVRSALSLRSSPLQKYRSIYNSSLPPLSPPPPLTSLCTDEYNSSPHNAPPTHSHP